MGPTERGAAQDLRIIFEDDRFYRDHQDIAKQEAIAGGKNVGLITSLIEERVGVNSSYEDGNSGLMMAAVNGRLNVIQCFLDHGVNVNAVSLYGRTALDEAQEALYNKRIHHHNVGRCWCSHIKRGMCQLRQDHKVWGRCENATVQQM
eukprot:scaffold1064_cov85-Amphora_coffeaeformis.AAC.13